VWSKDLKRFWREAKYAACSVQLCKISNATKNQIQQSFVHCTAKDASYTLCLTELYHITAAQHSPKFCVSVSFGLLQRTYSCQQLYASFSNASRLPIIFLTRLPASFDIDPPSLTDYPAFDDVCWSAILSGHAACSVTSSFVGHRSRCPNSLCRRIHFKAVCLKAGFLENLEFREGV
jgi:hypothetical protein